jgi:beta-N-acetylhexosaminidase
MTSHIVNKKIEPKGYPGTLSNRVMDSLLRKKMGYHGVIFSDDMQMHAITKYYGLEDAIKLAINAGVDIMCFSNNIQGSEVRTVDKVHEIIKGFVASGQIKKERIDESFRRIMALKSKLKDPGAYYKDEIVSSRAEADVLRKQLADAQAKLRNIETENSKPASENSSSKKEKKKKGKN